MSEFIKIPKDFNSLHDLKDLVVNYELTEKFINALKNYQKAYLDNFLMNYDDVLTYIPESQQSKYNIYIRSYNDYEFMHKYIGQKKPGADKNGNIRLSLPDALLNIGVNKTDKVFLVDTKNKKINVCFWQSTYTKKAKKWGYNRIDIDNINVSDVDFTNNLEFTLDPKNKVLVVKVFYTFEDTQSVGGVWINGRARGYLSGASRVPYTRYGHDIYHFCTRTNKFLGYKGREDDEARGWQEIRSRY